MQNQAEDLTRGDVTIWRYMDLARFVSILATRRLWFAKAATLRDDSYEGFAKAARLTVPPGYDVPKWIARKMPDGNTSQISPRQMMADFSDNAAEVCENAREYLYVNSWCLGESESMAMWQIYGSLGSGVALKSSINRYQRAAKFEVNSSQYAFGNVKYHDDLDSSPDIQRDFRSHIPVGSGLWSEVLQLGLHKRSCYEFENEWRAVLYQDLRTDIEGIPVIFDLDQLISGVYVGPRAELFMGDVVSSIMDKFLLRKPLERLVLLKSPRIEKASPSLGYKSRCLAPASQPRN